MATEKILIVTAAGSGARMGAAMPKQFLDLDGKPVLRRTIETFVSAVPGIKVITVLPEDHLSFWKEYCLAHDFSYPQTLVCGGFTRFHSVKNALAKVPDDAIVAIHDGVRPLLSERMVTSMFARMEAGGLKALIPVVPMVDTLKVIDKETGENGEADRSCIFGAQTPQMFVAGALKEAYSQAFDTAFTDDASVAKRKGIPLSFCEGERLNFKLTTPEDLSLARLVISTSSRRK